MPIQTVIPLPRTLTHPLPSHAPSHTHAPHTLTRTPYLPAHPSHTHPPPTLTRTHDLPAYPSHTHPPSTLIRTPYYPAHPLPTHALLTLTRTPYPPAYPSHARPPHCASSDTGGGYSALDRLDPGLEELPAPYSHHPFEGLERDGLVYRRRVWTPPVHSPSRLHSLSLARSRTLSLLARSRYERVTGKKAPVARTDGHRPGRTS